MAPTRKKKKGLDRIDAAVDAMRPMGFSRSTTVKAVNKLLKVYGGNDGFIFIEEACYKVLLDELLPEEGQEEPAMMSLDGRSQDECELVAVEKGGMIEAGFVDAQCQDECELVAVEKGGMIEAGFVDAQCLSSFDPGSCSRQALEDEERLKTKPKVPLKRRQPCYGWLSESDSDCDEDEVIRITQKSIPRLPTPC
ncbi:Histone-lysine N-methyltransferase [Zostera marina]|uniref:Histone-lysine N-methyltransferase n=1 Tax=Zostera marina TaxID=29655 RepID=A0A0K9P5V6_ZOSMR|nr:Histone-lysine N-methyltransferase [Zostera marina]